MSPHPLSVLGADFDRLFWEEGTEERITGEFEHAGVREYMVTHLAMVRAQRVVVLSAIVSGPMVFLDEDGDIRAVGDDLDTTLHSLMAWGYVSFGHTQMVKVEGAATSVVFLCLTDAGRRLASRLDRGGAR